MELKKVGGALAKFRNNMIISGAFFVVMVVASISLLTGQQKYESPFLFILLLILIALAFVTSFKDFVLCRRQRIVIDSEDSFTVYQGNWLDSSQVRKIKISKLATFRLRKSEIELTFLDGTRLALYRAYSRDEDMQLISVCKRIVDKRFRAKQEEARAKAAAEAAAQEQIEHEDSE